MDDNLYIYDAAREVPDSARRPISGGRLNGKTDINPMWRIKKLTELFGPCGTGWYYRPVSKWTESHGEETAAFVDIELYIRTGEGWSMPISGTGGSMLATKEKSGVYVSDECYKMATTDAISVACKQLGIGADVYWDKDSSKYGRQGETVDPRFAEMEKELIRTGYSIKSICKTYKVGSPYEMSSLQIKDFLEKIRELPDRAV